MFGVVNALNNPGAPAAAQNSGDLRVVLFVNGTAEWRGSFAQFLLDNTFAPVAVKEIAHKLSAGTPHVFGGGAEPTFRLEREAQPAVASNLVTLSFEVEDSGPKFIGQGISILAALGKIDEQVFAYCRMSLCDDGAFDITECVGELLGAAAGTRYQRRDFSTPEDNFTITLVEGGAS